MTLTIVFLVNIMYYIFLEITILRLILMCRSRKKNNKVVKVVKNGSPGF